MGSHTNVPSLGPSYRCNVPYSGHSWFRRPGTPSSQFQVSLGQSVGFHEIRRIMEDNSVISIKSSSSSTASKTSNAAYNEAHPGLIPNDTMLALSITALLIFLLYEIYSNRGSRRKKDHESNASSQSQVVPSSRRHVPLPQPVFQGVVQLTPTIMDATALSRYIPNKIPVYKLPIEEEETKPSDEAKQDANATTETVLIGLPQIPGCELNSVAVDRLLKDFPLMSRSDLVRFLVARKGNIEAATEMIRKANSW